MNLITNPNGIVPVITVPVRWKETIADGRAAAICSIVDGSWRLKFFNSKMEAADFVAKSNARLDIKE